VLPPGAAVGVAAVEEEEEEEKGCLVMHCER
jgi:hypothetical protein